MNDPVTIWHGIEKHERCRYDRQFCGFTWYISLEQHGLEIVMRFPGVARSDKSFSSLEVASGTSFGGRPPPMLHQTLSKWFEGYTALHGKYDRAGRPVSPLHWKGGLDGGVAKENKLFKHVFDTRRTAKKEAR